MAVSKAAIGATAGTGTAAAAATTALTVGGGGASGEKVGDSLDSVAEPSVNDESDAVNEPDTSLPKTTEKTLDESANSKDASDPVSDKDRVPGGPSAVDEVSNQGQKGEVDVKGPEVSEKSLDELLKEEITSKVLEKTWKLTNDVFMSNLEPYYCLQKLFDENLEPKKESVSITSGSHKIFENNDRKAFGCLGLSYFRKNKKDTPYWKGISAWEWGIRKGDEGFIYMGSFKNSKDNNNKINYYSRAFHIEKEGESWVPKHYKEVNGATIDISDSNKKIPKGSTKLPDSNEDYSWGLYSETTKNNSCKLHERQNDGNCNFPFSASDDVTNSESTKYWFWEEGIGNTKFKDMQSNFDDWWADAFPNNDVDLQGVQEKEGSWTAW